jgi:ribosomal protein S18 acetylase RimI-like enzyme
MSSYRGVCGEALGTWRTSKPTYMNTSVLMIQNDVLLDNPVWHSLAGHHAHLAVGAQVGRGLARRYPAEIGPLSALREETPEAYAELAAIVPEGDIAILFFDDPPEIPAGWQLLRGGRLVQMVCAAVPEEPVLRDAIVPLEEADFPEMVELTALTEPGPFRAQTGRLGGFLGIRVEGRLAAMAGQRMSLDGFAEVSAVCTHPEFRGRGFAQAVVGAVAREVHAAGRVPFLTAFETNIGAIRVYEQVGFVERRRFELAVVRPPALGKGAGAGWGSDF